MTRLLHLCQQCTPSSVVTKRLRLPSAREKKSPLMGILLGLSVESLYAKFTLPLSCFDWKIITLPSLNPNAIADKSSVVVKLTQSRIDASRLTCSMYFGARGGGGGEMIESHCLPAYSSSLIYP